MQLVLRMRATRCTESLYGFAARFAKVVLHKNCAGHSAHPAQCKLCGKAPLKPPAGLWYNNKERKLRWKVCFCSCFPYKRKRCTISQYQAGTLVVYGNLGVHEIEAVGPQSFCGEPAREYYTLRPYFSDSHDRSYIPTAKEGVLRPVSTPEQAAACLEQVRSEPDAAPASANQTVLAEHYQAVIHTNDFYEYLKLYRELAHKQSTQRSKGRKVNAMDAYFYQMAERTLREELAVAFHETPEAAARRLEAAVS